MTGLRLRVPRHAGIDFAAPDLQDQWRIRARRWAMSGRDEREREPTREEIDRTEGPVVLEFGASWCPYCRALAPKLAGLLGDYPEVQHIRVEDGPGKPLGRSFRVKLWPNLVFLRDGQVIKQLARPDVDEVREALQAIAGAT
jgi:thioredoxin 1